MQAVEKPCPVCNGLGTLNTTVEAADVLCGLCLGRGVVDPNRICFNCGRPAYGEVHHKQVCDRETCKKAAEPLVSKTGYPPFWDSN